MSRESMLVPRTNAADCYASAELAKTHSSALARAWHSLNRQELDLGREAGPRL
jgi:hypothetical protein